MKTKRAVKWTRLGRRGVVAVMFGLLLPVFIGFASLSVDTAMVATAQAQMRTAADAAALAGVRALATNDRLKGATDLSSEIAAVNAQAIAFAQQNRVLNAVPVLTSNNANTANGDILVGYFDTTRPDAPLETSSSKASQFNAVQVTISRDASHGGPVPTIFAQLFGYRGTNVRVSSIALVKNYNVAGFRPVGTNNATLLPIALDRTTWQEMMKGNTTDKYTYNPTTGRITSGADGIAESQLYPVKSGSAGNWGTIKVGVYNNSSDTLSSQIERGITPTQISNCPGGKIELDEKLATPCTYFEGNPGISSGIKDSLNKIIGKPVVVPVYDQVAGKGDNTSYRIIAFQPARVLSVNFQGSAKAVIIQPCLSTDPTVIPGTTNVASTTWSNGGFIRGTLRH